ncbi:golgin IMH1-like isoform X2 [Ischnura elegans]|uniref:golgin IMH1-like isoform X2 n=1 Tax=Ischnura elegans TaxID=197161 RepID=UPI001ED86BB6|nr:golgin IMH1-like isoform X2 [Ischnura elegans]
MVHCQEMSQLNEKLLQSLACDLNEVDKITRNIIPYVGEIQAYSWKFPNCQGNAIDSMQLMTIFSGSKEDEYHLITELLIDRLNFFLHTLLKFLESFPLSRITSKQCTPVSPPTFMSFAAIIHSIWEKLKTIYAEYIDNKEKNLGNKFLSVVPLQKTSITKEMLDGCSQTTMVSLEQCENCQSSTKCVKNIVTCIENMFSVIHKASKLEENGKPLLESAVSRVKNELGDEIWKVTQWKVMTKIVDAITIDTSELEDQLAQYFSEKCILSKKLRIESREVSSLDNERKQLMKDMAMFEDKEEDLLDCNSNLKEMLSKKNNEIENLSNYLDELKTTNESLKRDLEDTAKKLLNTQCELSSTKEDVVMKSEEANIFKHRTELQARKKVQGEISSARRSVEQLEEQLLAAQRNADTMVADMEAERVQFLFHIQELQGNLEQAKREKESLIWEVQKSQLEKSSTLNQIEDLKSRLKSMREESLLMAKYPDLSQHMDFELTGIPEVDVENQMKANRYRIKLLHEENANLQKTIQTLKMKKRETSV